MSSTQDILDRSRITRQVAAVKRELEDRAAVRREILESAKAIVEAGWTQGSHTDGRGAYCLRAAVGLASGHMIPVGEEMVYSSLDKTLLVKDTDACHAVCEHLPHPFESIPRFNDDPRTTKADVLAVLDKAIASC